MASNTFPKVQLSRLLRDDLIAEGFDPIDFADYFACWKALGAAGEYSDWYFGKDGFYDRPLRNNKRVLRHVHLPPEGFPEKLREWDRLHDLGNKRKTSNSILIYVHDPVNGYLLLHMVREPDGHSFSDMDTPETDQFMNQLADVAEDFIYLNAVNL